MVFIEMFLRKDAGQVTREDVEAFVSRRVEENPNLDYKDIRSYFDFDELSKDVSAFANSEGGLIILGVSEDTVKKGEEIVKIYPKEITWGDETHSKERLEDHLISKIRPRINGLRIQPIREGEDSLKVIFLIDVPQSDNRPHMSSDNRYWKRLNFRKTPMEHSEVADFLKMNWAIKEKLIEKIYEPLSQILEKHTKELSEYFCSSRHEIEKIMPQTYYKLNMPFELLEEIDDYIDGIRKLDREVNYARRVVANTINKNVLEFLGKKYPTDNEPELWFNEFHIPTLLKI